MEHKETGFAAAVRADKEAGVARAGNRPMSPPERTRTTATARHQRDSILKATQEASQKATKLEHEIRTELAQSSPDAAKVARDTFELSQLEKLCNQIS